MVAGRSSGLDVVWRGPTNLPCMGPNPGICSCAVVMVGVLGCCFSQQIVFKVSRAHSRAGRRLASDSCVTSYVCSPGHSQVSRMLWLKYRLQVCEILAATLPWPDWGDGCPAGDGSCKVQSSRAAVSTLLTCLVPALGEKGEISERPRLRVALVCK